MLLFRHFAVIIIFCITLLSCTDDNSPPDSGGQITGPVGISQRPDNQTCIAPDSPNNSTTDIVLDPAFENLPGLGSVVSLLQAPNDSSSWYAVQQNGVVKRFDNDPNIAITSDFLDISPQVDSNGNEKGLLGMAFHPDYVNGEGDVFLSYTRTDIVDINGGTKAQLRSYVSRFARIQGVWQAGEPVLVVNQPYSNHNGGNIAFGPDGYLYFGLGDGGSGNDPDENGQNTQTLLGSMLRIDVNQGTPYSIPNDNPFFGNDLCNDPELVTNPAACPEIFAYGFRNPWRWSFDRSKTDITSALWLGDVGQDAREEINRVELGENYGWKIMEGLICRPGTTCDPSGLTLPIVDYPHVNNNQYSVVGGYVYQGSNPELAFLTGTYLYADTYSGKIWGITGSNDNYTNTELFDLNGYIFSFAQDNEGELYVLSPTGGAGNNILKINADLTAVGPSQIAANLSQSGCVDTTDPTQAASGLIPYEVIAPLWSDGATKQRFIAMPNNTRIQIDANGDFIFPIGTVLMKNFLINDRIVETRLLMRHKFKWGGYSYEWQYNYNAQDEPTDAVLLTDAKTKFIEGQNWFYPSPGDCFSCHVDQSNTALGPEVLQLNHSIVYAQSGIEANQINTLQHIGIFTAAVGQNLKTATLFALDDEDASYQQRAKSYLHSNCAHCHQPEVTPTVTMDFRFFTELNDMNICDSPPSLVEPSLTSTLLLDPAGTFDTPNSIIIERMQSAVASGVRMPPLATELADDQAVGLFRLWANNLGNCL